MEFANQWRESKMFMQDVVKAKEPFGELHFKGMHHYKDKDKEVGKTVLSSGIYLLFSYVDMKEKKMAQRLSTAMI